MAAANKLCKKLNYNHQLSILKFLSEFFKLLSASHDHISKRYWKHRGESFVHSSLHPFASSSTPTLDTQSEASEFKEWHFHIQRAWLSNWLFWDIHKQTFFLSSNINTNYSKECLPMRHESMSKRHYIAGKEFLARSNVSYVIFIRRLNIKSIQLSSHVRQDYERFARLLMLRFSSPASRKLATMSEGKIRAKSYWKRESQIGFEFIVKEIKSFFQLSEKQRIVGSN